MVGYFKWYTLYIFGDLERSESFSLKTCSLAISKLLSVLYKKKIRNAKVYKNFRKLFEVTASYLISGGLLDYEVF